MALAPPTDMDALFLTGGTGFVGRRVAAALAALPDPPPVRLLARDAARAPSVPGGRVVEGDLLEPGGWTPALEGATTLLHLAALTGKAPRREHWRQNVEATRLLLSAARTAGVRRIVFVSSIAAGYRNRPGYHYAAAKAQAEADVRESGLDWLVVRPTLVLGPGSPVLDGLVRLASLPRPVMFGRGQPTQPIHVDDLAGLLVAAAGLPRLGGATIDAGGPEAIALAELLARLRAARGLPPRAPVHVPLGPVRAALAALEPVALGLLPLTAGQLALFANPSVAAPHPLHAALPRPRRDLSAMLAGAATAGA